VSTKQIEKLIERLGILVVDENQYMRKLTRMMLMNIGAKAIYEAADGLAALDVIRTANPDVVLLDCRC
jgi:two-component system chemotaxis response regulator CheY